MLNQKTSHELNEILDSAYDKIESVNNTVEHIKQDVYDRMKIMKFEYEYMSDKINKFIAGKIPSEQFYLFDSDIKSDSEHCGYSTCGKIEREINTFNIIVPTTNEAFYRDIADVYINDKQDEDYKTILMHDNCSNKRTFLYQNTENSISLDIEVNKYKALTSNIINSIEFDMGIAGSYTITDLKLYNNYDDENPCYQITEPIKKAGKFRMILDKEYSFKKAHIVIQSTFQTKDSNVDIYPFVINHIYFNKISIKNNSYGIIKINADEYIDTVYDDIRIKTPTSEYDSNISVKHIELYLKCDEDGNLSLQQEQSKISEIKSVSVNTDTIYAKVPLQTNESIIGIKFNVSTSLY